MRTLSKYIKEKWKLIAIAVATPLLLTSCYYLGVITVSKPGNDSLEEIHDFIQHNNFYPEYSFKLDSVGFHRLGYGIHKLESNQHVGSQIQIRVFDNIGNLTNGLSLCHGDFETKQFLWSLFPPTALSKSSVSSTTRLYQLSEHWGISEQEKAAFSKDVKASDLTILIVWNSSASYYSKRIMKEVDRYKSMFEDKKILTCYLNASTEAGGFQEEFLQEIADTLDNNSRAIDITNTAEHLMHFGQYSTALKVLSNIIPGSTTSIEKQRIETAVGVSWYMSQEYYKAIEHLNSILTDSLNPSIEQIVYVGKSIEQTQGPFKALEYYHNLSIKSSFYNRYVSPRILICEFNAQPNTTLERQLRRIRFDYPYSSEINYILGKHSLINGNSKDACGYYESGSNGRELYPEYSQLCRSALTEHCNSAP